MRHWIESTSKDLAGADYVHITLDAVIFGDGLLIGDKVDQLAPHFDSLVGQNSRRIARCSIESTSGRIRLPP